MIAIKSLKNVCFFNAAILFGELFQKERIQCTNVYTEFIPLSLKIAKS